VKLLRVCGYQTFANYRKPMSFNFWDTYPLPPLSTVRGWFHSVVEAKEYIPIAMSIQGTFDGVVHDLQRLMKFDRPSKANDMGYPLLEGFNRSLARSPTYVANVYNVRLCIYLRAEEELLELFAENILKKEYPHLGRYEDLLMIEDIRFVEVDTVNLFDEPHAIKYGIYLNRSTADSLGLKGINYRMNFKYDEELKSRLGVRYFEKRDVVYVDNGLLETDYEILFDFDKERIIDLIGDMSHE